MSVGLGADDRRGLAAVGEAVEDALVEVIDAAGGRPFVIVDVVPEPLDGRIAERCHQVRADTVAELVFLEAAQEPRPSGIPRLELQRAVELRGVTDDLVAEEGVVVRVGDDYDLFVGRLERLAGGQRYRVARQLQREVHQMRELDKFLLEAMRDQLPAALVPREVV